MTGGIARYARSTPGYIPRTAPRCPRANMWIVIAKISGEDIRIAIA